jgi:accessory gene regulator B
MERISKKLTNWLIAKNVITTEQEEVYEYGVFQMLTNMLDTISMLVVAVFFQKILAVCCYILCFSMLRKYAGGYHAKSVMGCYIMTVGSTFLMLTVISFYRMPMAVIIAVWLISGIIVLLFAPVQNRNKKLDEVEHLVYRRRTIIIWILVSAFMWGLYSLKFVEGTEGILFGNILIAISMLIELKSLIMVKEKGRCL